MIFKNIFGNKETKEILLECLTTRKIKPENLKMRHIFRGLRKIQKKDISELKNLNLVIIDHDAMMKRSKGVFDLKV